MAVTERAPLFELAVPCEIFGIDRPELADPWYDMRVCSVEPDTTVAAGFVAGTAADMTELTQADTVIVPACVSMHEPPQRLVEAVRSAYEAGARIASICSGSFVLAAAGLLDGRRATTHWMHADELADRYPAVEVDPSVLYLEDGGVFTSAGTAAGIDLCLELVRRDHGTAVVNALARRLIVPPHRDGGQAQYVRLPAAAPEDTGIAPLLDWARAHLREPLTLDDFAQQSHLSRRTLARRFHDALALSPLRWLQRERVRHAQHLLETTDIPVEHIADQSGLGSATNLRRHFLDHVGVSPQRYRHTFHQAGRGDRSPNRSAPPEPEQSRA
ncbi:helix-turn-helix domain-containing protein [Saccharopolyspora halophila]|uniref:Helix-turn-helix domain-containing protein n=1 Tax=Saccharopolyspora halophila TaxID=405551 RepID=A0ABN3GTH2_9PSEU